MSAHLSQKHQPDEADVTLKRITYVEDEPDIREIARIALADIGGFELDLCESGREALSRSVDFQPDMFLLDVMMPGMDGMETFRVLRAMPEFADTPAAFLTAKVQEHEIRRYRDLGIAGVIVKPFDPITLADTVRRLWDQSRH
jgi:CheY-like chemotaxis protein